ncbi:MAG: hypothetical protein ABEJ06_02835 [Haloarculaceae archaeon]
MSGDADEHGRVGLGVVTERPPARSTAHLSRVGAVGLAVVATVALTALRFAVDAPVSLGVPVGTLFDPVVTDTLAAGGLAMLVLGATGADHLAVPSLGLLFVGVFAGLAAVAEAATVPAAGAVVVGCWAVLRPWRRQPRTRAVRLAFALGLALTVGAATGLLSLDARGLGTAVVLLGYAATPLLVEATPGRLAWGVGAGVLVVVSGALAPFVTGALALTLSGVAGVSLLLLGLAVTGLTTTLAAALDDRRPAVVAGVCLLVGAGVPVSVQRGVALVLGAALVCGVVALDPEVARDG